MSAFTVNVGPFEGNLVADPILRTTGGGKPVANFRIAVTSRVRTGPNEYKDSSEFMNVVAWDNLAVNAAASFKKGTRVIVAGNFKERSWTGKDGDKRYTPEVHATMLGVSTRWHVVAGVERADQALVSEEAPESTEDPVFEMDEAQA